MMVRKGRRFEGETRTVHIHVNCGRLAKVLGWKMRRRGGRLCVPVIKILTCGMRRWERRWDGQTATDWMLRTFLDALHRSTVDCRELRGMHWAGRSPLLGSIVRCRPKSLVEVDLIFLPRPMFRQAKTLAYFINAIVPSSLLQLSTRNIKTEWVADTELSIRRLSKIQKNISAHHVLGISDLVVHSRAP
jgi:hypothetical protein